jgi:hypothetical protein
MDKQKIPILGLACGILAVAAANVHAQGILAPLTPGGPADVGSSFLSDVLGSGPGSPESLTVNWSVSENLSGIYTYAYAVFNPPGDIQLPGSVAPGAPEIVDYYSVNFNSTVPGALVAGPFGGAYSSPNGLSGVFWIMPPVAPGTGSGVLSYQSALPPIYGNANASDANPPSPWSSAPFGQQVPVPNTAPLSTPEPGTLGLFIMSGASALGVWRSRRSKAALNS